MPDRTAAWCGLLAPVVFLVGWVLGSIAQPDEYNWYEHTLSDLGSLTAASPWLYNQLSANLTGVLVVVFALGLWPAVRDRRSGRLAVIALVAMGLGQFLDGFLRLDCRELDVGCENRSWHSTAHEIESLLTLLGLVLAPFFLWRAIRGVPGWSDLSRVSLGAGIATLVTLIGLSGFGEGLAQRVGATIWFVWLAIVALRLLRVSSAPAQHGSPRPA